MSATAGDSLRPWSRLAAGLALILLGCAEAPHDPPNIVIILADDLGYMDVVSYAARMRGVSRSETYYETPNIDRLADEGVAFSQAYANQLCSPTRAALLTGRYHARLGVTTGWFDGARHAHALGQQPLPGHHALDVAHDDAIEEQQAWLNARVMMALAAGSELDAGWDELTLPEILDDYDSAFVGKWHLGAGGLPAYQPDRQGFDHVLAHLDSGASAYFGWQDRYTPGSWQKYPTHRAIHDEPRLQGSWQGEPPRRFLTDAFTDLAVAYIEQRATIDDEPFLLYFSHFSVHGPFQAKPQDIRHFESKATRGWNGQSKPVQAAMIKVLDDSVGRVVDALERTGQSENTVIVFMSDNGGFLYEGGIRVPLSVWAPGRFAAGWSSVPVHCIDLVPTLSALAGRDLTHEIDGVSLVPLLEHPAARSTAHSGRALYWHYPFNVKLRDPAKGNLPLTPQSAIRRADHKLVWDWHGKLELYDLSQDVSELRDLSTEEPALAKELFEELADWLDHNVERRYFPSPNPDYDATRDRRPYPHRDLRRELLGRSEAPGLPDRVGHESAAR